MEKSYPNIYKNEIPLPNNPLRAVNSYIILSEDRNLIIDTGFNCKECRETLFKGIKELGIELNKTDLLVTHLHSDHSGLAAALNKEGVKIYASKIDGKMINKMTETKYWKKLEEYIKMFDLEKDKISFADHPGEKYCPKEPIEFTPLEEGDVLNVGDYSFQIIDIPGHTPGHIGLYEKKHKIFFCGDHILDKITPNIAFWGFEYNDILEVYFNSLKKVYEYDIDYLFSAHRNIIRNHKKRIDELFKHHEKRLCEIIEILKYGKKTVRDTAANMHWELRYDCWEDFPNPQKWFASGEAMSHLEHLVFTGKAKKTNEEGILYYELNK
ncbi:MBL fold metallo-hydrolase [Paramaledivibacter caminithermalis]|jgi:glyoxylase-like metal-dependent hydrolase (beta-lactamase superfamily II)|uniref:Glyoxylase, beta-lactamase superfamily II n=1 Tax=Paramaledivibacter caminithermalis (strain DSM 15212 / CIP 107654 / DViRD3) TaxID=1121301 RepID=A0A1M6K382_PARC5|nr:MBL fold metallo-hydrolase [Paramaledivibacter caminithermalis]SHJ53386.1 Glyoxylase, beta-lactamase superfamily II [Paramaledivibacter caminithermalis DSM 15212]